MSESTSDRELLEQAVSGDQVAQQQLLLRYYDRLSDHVARKIPARFRGMISTEDVVQQTFLQVLRNISKFSLRNEHSLYAWIRTIADNRLTDTIRHFSYEPRATQLPAGRRAASVEQSRAADLVDLLSAGHTPSRSVARHEAVAAVQDAMNELPVDYLQAIELRVFDGKSLAETAAIMQRTPRAVQGLVDRAKKKMRDVLDRLSLYE